jgi:hypothetical protein
VALEAASVRNVGGEHAAEGCDLGEGTSLPAVPFGGEFGLEGGGARLVEGEPDLLVEDPRGECGIRGAVIAAAPARS